MTVKNILTSSLIKCLQLKMALKNYIAKSLFLFFFFKSGKRFKRSIAHNNLKLTCNIYHIQVLKLPFLRVVKITWADGGGRVRGGGPQVFSFLTVFYKDALKSCAARLQSSFLTRLISLSCASCRGLRGGGGQHAWGGGRRGQVRAGACVYVC